MGITCWAELPVTPSAILAMYTANRPKFSNKNTAPLTAAFFREHNAGITRQLKNRK
jgi:hypothetical protein